MKEAINDTIREGRTLGWSKFAWRNAVDGTANDFLSSRPVDLVLSNTHLSDGTGFGLLAALGGLPVTAFLCLPVENSCFWLPAINGGKECLGLPAPRPSEFSRAIEEMTRCLSAAPPGN